MSKSNIGTYRDRWFSTYKGMIYKNKVTDINNAINNKVLIDSRERRVKVILAISETHK